MDTKQKKVICQGFFFFFFFLAMLQEQVSFEQFFDTIEDLNLSSCYFKTSINIEIIYILIIQMNTLL